MRLEATTISGGSRLQFDVCVVGAGPCGLALAEDLANAGWKVGVIESGADEPTAESQELGRGVRRGLPYPRLEHARARAIGGTSWKWLEETGDGWLNGGLRCRPLDALDFEVRRHVPGSGWPIAQGEITAWFLRATEVAGIDAGGFDRADAALLPRESGVETAVSLFASNDVFRRRIPALIEHANVTLLVNATVLRIDANDDGRIESLQVATNTGAFSVAARAFVLAGGGIENARMLLASKLGRPGGLANGFDQIGRYFMEHIHVDSGYFQPALPGSLEDLVGPYRRQRDSHGAKRALSLRLSDDTQLQEGTLNSIVEFFPRRSLFTSAGVRSFAELAWGSAEKSAPQNVLRHVSEHHPTAPSGGGRIVAQGEGATFRKAGRRRTDHHG